VTDFLPRINADCRGSKPDQNPPLILGMTLIYSDNSERIKELDFSTGFTH